MTVSDQQNSQNIPKNQNIQTSQNPDQRTADMHRPTGHGQGEMEKSTRDDPGQVAQTGGQSYELRPDWRIYLPAYVIGGLLAPLLVGIWIIYRYRKKWLGMRYVVTNSEVIHESDGLETRMPLHDITACEVRFDGLAARFGLGTIHIRHTGGTQELPGIPDPEPVAVLIERAAESERDRMKMREEIEKSRPRHPSGTLERKNELVGLWQQGLISEEDYQREMRHFENP